MGGRWGEELLVADGGDEGDDLDAVDDPHVFFCYCSSGNTANCLAGAASTAAAARADAVLHLVCVVGVAWAGEHVHCASSVVFRSLVFILD